MLSSTAAMRAACATLGWRVMSQVADPTPARTMSAMTVMKMRIAGASIPELFRKEVDLDPFALFNTILIILGVPLVAGMWVAAKKKGRSGPRGSVAR